MERLPTHASNPVRAEAQPRQAPSRGHADRREGHTGERTGERTGGMHGGMHGRSSRFAPCRTMAMSLEDSRQGRQNLETTTLLPFPWTSPARPITLPVRLHRPPIWITFGELFWRATIDHVCNSATSNASMRYANHEGSRGIIFYNSCAGSHIYHLESHQPPIDNHIRTVAVMCTLYDIPWATGAKVRKGGI